MTYAEYKKNKNNGADNKSASSTMSYAEYKANKTQNNQVLDTKDTQPKKNYLNTYEDTTSAYETQGYISPERSKELNAIGQEISTLKKAENEAALAKYSNISKNDDYLDYSKYVSNNDIRYGVINQDEESLRKNKELKYGSMENEVALPIADYDSNLGYLTDDEKGVYNYLYNKDGKDSAEEYLSLIQGNLNERMYQKQTEDSNKFAEENPGIATWETILTSPAKGMSFIGQTVDMLKDGAVDENAWYNTRVNRNQTIRENVTEQKRIKWEEAARILSNDNPELISPDEIEKFGNTGAFLYQTKLSMADNIANMFASAGLGPMAEVGTLLLMSSGAAADSVIEKKRAGYSDERAFATGLVAGAVEYLTEKIGLDALFNRALIADKGMFRYWLSNVAAEGGEEGLSDILNFVADGLYDEINGEEQSEFKLSVQQYIAQGMTEAEATGKAAADWFKQFGLDILGGAISGGVMGAGGMVRNAALNTAYGSQLNSEINPTESSQIYRDYIDQGLELDPKTQGYKQAVKANEQFAETGKLSNYRLGTLANAMNVRAQLDSQAEELLAQAKTDNNNPELIQAISENESALEALGVQTEYGENEESIQSKVAKALASQHNEISSAEQVNTQTETKTPEKADFDIARDVEGFKEAQSIKDNKDRQTQSLNEQMDAVVETLGEEGKAAFNSIASGADRVLKYAEAQKAFKSGLEGQGFKASGNSVLTSQEQRTMWYAGVQQAQNYAKKNNVVMREGGYFKNEYTARISNNAATVLDDLGKALGTAIKVVGASNTFNAKYNNGAIEIAVNAYNGELFSGNLSDETIKDVVAHELTHRMQELSPKAYNEYKKAAIEFLKQRGTYEAEYAKEASIEKKNFGKVQNLSGIEDELVSNFAGELLKKEDTFRNFAKDNRTVAEKFLDLIKDIAAAISKMLGKETSLDSIERKYRKLLNESVKVVKNYKGEYATETQNGADGNKFSGKSPVEETKNLLALHNLTEDNLLSAIELGGFAMPSIAVVKSDMGHSKFGPISVVFSKDTIDPKKNKNNRIYGADAYTPTMPQIDYQANTEVEKRITDLYYELKDKWGEQVRPLYRYVNDLGGELDRWRGQRQMISSLRNDASMMQVYHIVKDGKPISNAIKTETKQLTDNQVKNANILIKEFNLTKEDANKIGTPRWARENKQKLQDIAYQTFKDDGDSEETSRIAYDLSALELSAYLCKPAQQMLTKGRNYTEKSIDYAETTKKIIAKTNGQKYTAWLNELFDGAEKSKGIRNSRDMFTSSGNRRSFESLHDPVNISNVVKVMKAGEQTGVAAFGSSAYGASAQQYYSLSEVKNNSSRLELLDDTEYSNLKKKAQNRFTEIAQSIVNNPEGAWDAESMFAEAISRYGTDKARLSAYIQREGKGWTTFRESAVDELIDIVNKVRSMPTGYFEAKPARAVSFDEALAYVVPDNISKELKSVLDGVGANVLEYKTGDEADRLAKLNSVEGARFSAKDSEGNTLSEAQQKYFEESKALNDNGDLEVVYHGSKRPGFTKFNRTYNFFTSSKDIASSYDWYEGAKLYKGYLNIKNPLVVDAQGSSWGRIPISGEIKSFLDKYEANVFQVDGKWYATTDDIAYAVMDAIDAGENYDGAIIKNVIDRSVRGKNNENVVGTDYITYNSSQFKNIDNLNPTNNEDIRFSAKDSDGNSLTQAQVEYFKNSQVRDDYDNLKVVYHGTNVSFNEFLHDKIDRYEYGYGFYFTDDYYTASNYGAKKSNYNGESEVKEGYLNITKPLSWHGKPKYLTTNNIKKIVEAYQDYFFLYDFEDVNEFYDRFDDLVYQDDGTRFKTLMEYVNDGEQSIILDAITDITGADGVIENTPDNGTYYIAFRSNQFKNIDNLNPTTNPDIRYSVKDSKYLELAKDPKKNESELRKMVDDAAKENGYTYKLYHGTNADFTVFDINSNKRNGNLWGKGIYLTDEESVADKFAKQNGSSSGKVLPLYVKIENPLDITFGGEQDGAEIRQFLGKKSNEKLTSDDYNKFINSKVWNDKFMLRDHGNDTPNYDAVIIRNGFDYNGNSITEYVVFDSNQTKSADLVTYDDSGNIIPLSERFNPENKDIRYSAKAIDQDYVSKDGKVATFTDERIDRIIEDNYYGKTDGKEKTRAYVAFINPVDFVKATTTNYESFVANETEIGNIKPLDENTLRKQEQTPFLIVEFSGIDNEIANIVGHEGRHRMQALADAGYTQVAVIIDDYDRRYMTGKKEISKLYLRGQEFNNGNGQNIWVKDATPLFKENAEYIKSHFGSEGQLRYSAKDLSKFDTSKKEKNIFIEAVNALDGVQLEIDFSNKTQNIKTIVDAFKRELIYDGGITFVGRTFNSVDEIGVAANVFRDPRYETIRYFFLDDNNKVVMNTGFTSQIPNCARLVKADDYSSESVKKAISELFKKAVKAGATNYYIMHNHPSGDPKPSSADYQATDLIKKTSDEVGLTLNSHIVIDHNKYTSFSVDTDNRYVLDEKTVDYSNGIKDELLSQISSITSADELAKYTMYLNGSDAVVAVYTNSRGSVTGIQQIPQGIFEDYHEAKNLLHDEAIKFGGFRTFLIAADKTNEEIIKALYKNAIVQDVIVSELQYSSQGLDRGYGNGSFMNVPEQVMERFSTKGTENAAQIASQNVQLQEKIDEINKLKRELAASEKSRMWWASQLKKTEVITARKEDVNKLSKSIVKAYNSTYDSKDLVFRMQALANMFLKENTDLGSAKNLAIDMARDVIENSYTISGDQDTEQSILKYLKATQINVPQDVRRNIGDYNAWRNRYFGKMKLGSQGMEIDQVWQELQGIYGTGLFPDSYDSTAELQYLAGLTETLGKTVVPTYSDYELADAIEFLANDIINRVSSDEIRRVAPTYADRIESKMQEKEKFYRKKITNLQDANYRLTRFVAEQIGWTEATWVGNGESAERRKLLELAQRLERMSKKTTAVNRAWIQETIGNLDTIAMSITGKKISDLRETADWIAEQKANNPDFTPDPRMENAVARLSKVRIADMSIEEVRELTDILKWMEHEIRTEKQLLDAKERRNIYELGRQSVEDIKNSKGNKTGLINWINTETLSPVRQMHRYTGYNESAPLYQLVNKLADGQRKMFDYQRVANEAFRKYTEDTAFIKEIQGKDAKEIEIQGLTKEGVKTVKITPAMRISLYLHSKNYQNMLHISTGGVTIPNMELYKKGNYAEAYNSGTVIQLQKSEIDKVAQSMTAKERVLARDIEYYFNVTSQNAINETSEILKGYSLAQVENYFPINTDSNFTQREFESIKMDGTIEGMGFLKERVNGKNPIMLRDANSVLEQSIRMTAKYVGLAVPVRNFSKVWNVGTNIFTIDQNRLVDSSVKKAMGEVWGESGKGYVEQMMKDINGVSASNRTTLDKALTKIRSNYAGAVLTLNASVALKQAASYPSAGSVIGMKPLIEALTDRSRIDEKLIAKYTPLFWYRAQGFSTQELGDLATIDKRLPKTLNWVQGIDLVTTKKLWKAAEYYVEENTKLQVGTDNFYKEVANIYNRIIEETQPNYTTMQRPQALRSGSSLQQSLLMFKTQPFQNFNIVFDAFGTYDARMTDLKNGVKGAEEAVKKAKTDLVNAIVSQAVATLTFVGMTLAWAALRGKMDPYKDEEGKISPEALLETVLTNLAGSIPFGTESYEIATAIIKSLLGKEYQYYGPEEITSAQITEVVNAITALTDLVSKDDLTLNTVLVKTKKAANTLSKVVGIPVENVLNMIQILYSNGAKAVEGKYPGQYDSLKWQYDPSTYPAPFYSLLYDAYKNDKEGYAELRRKMIKDGFKPDNIQNNIQRKLKEEKTK